MKPLVKAVAGLTLALPILSFAQGNEQPLTRAQVRADLVRAENAGYSPTAWADFPYGEVQAAEYRVAARRAANGRIGDGAMPNGVSRSGDIAR
ncbi:purine nucleoside phosphorylase [Caballeronia arvi]|uniref:Purine nucleoside phosphorylase n=1 Tax=Caballeronia arvi TaxID=1777135 RepID=A0A158KYW8_9BURK|nr:DUF4148 domain-containing protein [Caballeronia arvi]SAL85913.1 purine nucleoside phosphorylase [Caballeronia arvi]